LSAKRISSPLSTIEQRAFVSGRSHSNRSREKADIREVAQTQKVIGQRDLEL
jgi:hypothetical protein